MRSTTKTPYVSSAPLRRAPGGLATLLALALTLTAVAGPAAAVGGYEGSLEYALDAPWRIEPWDASGNGDLRYGEIPIQLTFHDAVDAPRDADVAGDQMPELMLLGNFCDLRVTDPGGTTTYRFDDLDEVEATWGAWAYPNSSRPSHRICRQWNGEICDSDFRQLLDTSEWHGIAWHEPLSAVAPGEAMELTLEARVARWPTSCEAADDVRDEDGRPAVFVFRNHVRVTFAEAPLPRFGDGWLYGDLHYHSQGTDNEGEAGYNYRNVVRAMGALGLDFVVAAEHASDAAQVVDGDIFIETGRVEMYDDVLRDMNARRFRFAHEVLHAPGGANAEAAVQAGGALPQGVRSHGVVPQIYLGGEIDAAPEVAPGEENSPIAYAAGRLSYDVSRLCGGWNSWLAWLKDCDPADLFQPATGGVLVRDVQGVNDILLGREHLVYMPSTGDLEVPATTPLYCIDYSFGSGSGFDDDFQDPTLKPCSECTGECEPLSDDPYSRFISSETGKYGGASRRLAYEHNLRRPLLDEIEEKGYAFLAHPLNAPKGSNGPDGPPWSRHMLDQAWRSPAILGLQFWNENVRRDSGVTSVASSGSPGREIGYDRSNVIGGASPVDDAREGFYGNEGLFELDPWDPITREWGRYTIAGSSLRYGASTWDEMNHWGLDGARTASLSWLPPGAPRKVFMAGGSDAHGDLNYRREGYFVGTTRITDTVIGSPRNLLSLPPDTGQTMPVDDVDDSEYPRVYSQDEVASALAGGRFSVTDGPALRLVIDRNQNGRIDDEDIPMGGNLRLHGDEELPLLVEWKSTPEFGAVASIDLYLGVHAGDTGRTYAPIHHGPHTSTGGGLPTGVKYQAADGRLHQLLDDGYWHVDPGTRTTLRIPSGTGSEPVEMCEITFRFCEDDGGATGSEPGPDDPNSWTCYTETVLDPCEQCGLYDDVFTLIACDSVGTVPGEVDPLPSDVYEGAQAVTLDLSAFEAAEGVPGESFFVRAFARTHEKTASDGSCDDRLGHCIERWAFTNPVWAVPAGGGCGDDPLALDRDGDLIPDACDACPDAADPSCE